MPRLLIGTSGWVYDHWKGVFYPEGLRQKDWFEYYSEHFDTVEINNSFYRLPPRAVFVDWRAQAPGGFLYTVKASRYITHVKKLKDPAEGLGNFYGNLEGMGEGCACVLFQLPPRFHANLQRLREFLELVPARYRVVMEFRDETWLVPETYDILADHGAALCAADSPFYPAPDRKTADFDFFRMHGGKHKIRPNYSQRELASLASKIDGRLEEGRDVFAYFNNDYAGYALKNATRLKELLSRWLPDGSIVPLKERRARGGGGLAGAAGRRSQEEVH